MQKQQEKYTVGRPDGSVILTNAKFRCTGCGKWKPASEVGLRKMASGVVRNQAQCQDCRKA